MNIWQKPQKLFIWDVHGKLDVYSEILELYDWLSSIQVWDFWFKKEHSWHLRNIDGTKHKINFWNHDDPSFLKSPHSLWDASFVDWIMSIRWADSIDKHLRTEWVDWWSEEELEYKFFLQLIEFAKHHKPRVIVSHDCPESVRERFFSIYDHSRTAQWLQAIFDAHKPEYWIFWHHHKRVDGVVEGTRFIGLEECWIFIL